MLCYHAVLCCAVLCCAVLHATVILHITHYTALTNRACCRYMQGWGSLQESHGLMYSDVTKRYVETLFERFDFDRDGNHANIHANQFFS
jgi:hypothetical protein